MILLIGLGIFVGYTASFSKTPSIVLVIVGVLLGVITLTLPSYLKWPLIIWLYFGKVLGEVTSTIILGFVYFFVFTPITFLKRIINKNTSKNTGWIARKKSKIDYNKLY